MSWGELTCEHYGNCNYKATMQTCNPECNHYIRKHDTNSEYCWCNPVIKEFPNGNKILVHNETPDTCGHDYNTCGFFNGIVCEIDFKQCANAPRRKNENRNS